MMAGPRTFTFLGTGTSVGVPMLGCDCDVCRSPDPRNHRTRCSVLVGTPDGNLLIDTTPEMRLQLVRERVSRVHAVLYTHFHADHLFGLDDLRLFPKYLGRPLPVYCGADVEEVIRRSFAYAFHEGAEQLPAGTLPKLVFRRITAEPFEVLGQRVVPVPLVHARYHVFGYRIGDVAYCTDVSHIPDASWPLLEGVRVFIVDALRWKPHPAHFGLEQALAAIDRLKPERAFLTHTSHDFDYGTIKQHLPPHVEMAYDGLRFEF